MDFSKFWLGGWRKTKPAARPAGDPITEQLVERRLYRLLRPQEWVRDQYAYKHQSGEWFVWAASGVDYKINNLTSEQRSRLVIATRDFIEDFARGENAEALAKYADKGGE